MNEKLQKQLSSIESCIGIQRDCIIAGDSSYAYMRGMLNGIIFVHSVLVDEEPNYHCVPRKKKNRTIRHKSVKDKLRGL